jgi:hypothetical protein
MSEFESCGRSAEQFWEKHQSQDGNKLGYQQLVAKLRQKRKDCAVPSDEATVDRLKLYFDGDIMRAQNVFMYRKKGKWHAKKKAASIVHAWRELLAKDKDLAECWDAWDANYEHVHEAEQDSQH